MYPDVDVMPLDKELLEKRFIVCDIVYNPCRTKLLEEAEKIGCQTLTGIYMLVYQGAESFRLWTGKEPPVKTMFEAISKFSYISIK
jgi:shikimate dehydrogenase